MHETRDSLSHALREAFAGMHELRLAVLFGSLARGGGRPDSDVDIAILPADPAFSLADELRLQTRLERACRRSVDLVRIDQASTLLAWQIARSAVLLFGEWRDFARFRARSALEYVDYAGAAERAAARYARNLRRDPEQPGR